MKLDRLETHDRYKHFTSQNFSIEECCQDMINKRPFGDHAFYIFAHSRTDDDGFNKRLIWQPRLTKPKAQTNSMLFKAFPGTDEIKVLWIIPSRELWPQYEKGKVTESNIVTKSIDDFQHRLDELERPDTDDLSDAAIDAIYKNLSQSAKTKKLGLIIPDLR